jgi:small-conductance mechanosensitive channel
MPTRRFIPAVAVALVVAAAVAGAYPSRAWAQDAVQAPAASEAQAEEAVQTAPVIIDGIVLFSVRGVSSFPAPVRAQVIAGRIVAVAKDPAFNPDSLRIEESEIASRILADRQLLMGVYDADGRVEGVRREVLALTCLERIRAAIVAYRTDRSAAAVEQATIRAAAGTAIAVVLVIATAWTWRRFDRALESRYRRRVEALTARSKDVVDATSVWTSVRNALRLARSVVLVGVGFLYVEYILALFPQTRSIAWNLGNWVLQPLGTMWASFAANIPSLIFLAVLFLVVRFLLTIIRRFFEAIEQGRLVLGHFEREWATPTYKLVRLLVIAFAVVVGYPYIPGSSSEAFKGVSLFLGVAFSLGSSSFLSNMIAGYSMNYRRLFKVGDRVKIGEVNGEVTAVRLQVTHVRTIRNEEVTIPNSVILNTHVINHSALARTKGFVLMATVGIGYETPWRQVEAMLLQAARRTPGLLPDPPPFIRQQALGDFAVTYALCVYTDQPLKMEATYTDLHRNILDVFNEYGVQIMTPAYEEDPQVPKIVPRDQWYMAPAEPDAPAAPDSRTQTGLSSDAREK